MEKEQMLVYNEKFKSINELFNIEIDTPIIAGPCSIESIEQLEMVAKVLNKNNIKFIRGGAFKPRTSPYDFQGLKLEGLKMLDYVRKKYNLIAVTEIVDPRDIEYGITYSDIIQIGSRNMQNFALLNEVGKIQKTVLLKRGMMSTVDEFVNAAEYIVSAGNKSLILCERGIRTFENSTRNMLDIACVAIIKNKTSLPIIVDLSHSLGRKDILSRVSKSVLALGADGVMIEMHPNPLEALSDSKQQLNFNEFEVWINNL